MIIEPTASFDEIVEALLELHPHLTKERLTSQVRFKEDGTLEDWFLYNRGLTELPECMGYINNVRGSLNLSGNELRSLPSSFSTLSIGGELNLRGNSLSVEGIPELFNNIIVGGRIFGVPFQCLPAEHQVRCSC